MHSPIATINNQSAYPELDWLNRSPDVSDDWDGITSPPPGLPDGRCWGRLPRAADLPPGRGRLQQLMTHREAVSRMRQGQTLVWRRSAEDRLVTVVVLQDCRDPATGQTHPQVSQLLQLAMASGIYTELSPDGRGYTCICRGLLRLPTVPAQSRDDDDDQTRPPARQWSRGADGMIALQPLDVWDAIATTGRPMQPAIVLLDREADIPMTLSPVLPGLAVGDGRRWLAEVVLHCLRIAGAGSAIDVDAVMGQPIVIWLGPDESRITDETIAALADDCGDIYDRHGSLVSLRSGQCTQIAPLTEPALRDRITRAIALKKLDSHGDLISAHPPEWLARSILARGGWPDIRPLTAVSDSPVFLPSGRVLATPGYDPESRIYLSTAAPRINVPEAPTLQQCRRAAARILAVYGGYAFVADCHRSSVLALILTIAGRPAFSGPSPLFAVSANTRGSGKSLLADTVGILTTGQDLARMTCPQDDAEMRKSITARVLQGCQTVLIDNVASELGGPALDAALTGTRWSDRILGRSETIDMPLTVTWLCTGNNLAYGADTARRVCPIRIRTTAEQPELRRFAIADLRQHVRDNRQQMLRDAMTVLRGYHVAGRPQQQLQGWGSFEGWSALVRQCIVWIGLTDPADGRAELQTQADPTAAALRQLLQAWPEVDPHGQGLTIGDLLRKLQRLPGAFHASREALCDLCGGSPERMPTSKTIGRRLASFVDRNLGGLCLQRFANREKTWCWRVTRVDEHV